MSNSVGAPPGRAEEKRRHQSARTARWVFSRLSAAWSIRTPGRGHWPRNSGRRRRPSRLAHHWKPVPSPCSCRCCQNFRYLDHRGKCRTSSWPCTPCFATEIEKISLPCCLLLLFREVASLVLCHISPEKNSKLYHRTLADEFIFVKIRSAHLKSMIE